MDEFLEKLAEDQRRMRDYFGSQAARFKKMGTILASARERLTRIFVVGEPPVDHVAYIVAVEYFLGLPAVLLSLEDKAPEPGDDALAKHLARQFKKGDVLVVLANSGQSEVLKALFPLAKKKGTHAILIGGLDAREQLRKLADSAVSLPTRGLRTVCESSFLVARILARCTRSALRESSGKEEEEKIVRADCEACSQPVFYEERKGKKAVCPLCKEPLKVRAARPGESLGASPPLTTKIKRKQKKPELEEAVEEPEKPARPKPSLKQSVLQVPAIEVAEFMNESPPEAGITIDPVEAPEPELDSKAGAPAKPKKDTAQEIEVPDTASPPETVIAPEDLAFDEFAGNATKTPDPFGLPNSFVADLVMPQGRAPGGGKTPSDENPATSGESAPAPDESSAPSASARLVSARYTVQDCRLRYGMGAFPAMDDETPDHPLDRLSASGLVFYLDPKDEVGATVEKGDELWITLVVPAFLEPVHARGTVVKIGGASDGNRAGTRLELEWKDLDGPLTRKLARAAENLGLAAER